MIASEDHRVSGIGVKNGQDGLNLHVWGLCRCIATAGADRDRSVPIARDAAECVQCALSRHGSGSD
jgi:hypothetical protein